MSSKLSSLALASALLAAVLAGWAPRAARANAPAGRYTVSGGVVYDTKTKLTWQQTASTTAYSYTDAKTQCSTAGAALGGTGWRMPTVKELMTLIDRSKATGPVIDTTAFLSTTSASYWTATTTAWSATGTWVVDFTDGRVTSTSTNFPNTNVVRCVR